jgi:hypothetical protein
MLLNHGVPINKILLSEKSNCPLIVVDFSRQFNITISPSKALKFSIFSNLIIGLEIEKIEKNGFDIQLPIILVNDEPVVLIHKSSFNKIKNGNILLN